MGVNGLRRFTLQKPFKTLLWEQRDLSDFKGGSLVIDGDSFLFWLLEEYLPCMPMYYWGDFAPDLLAALRHFVLKYFHGNDISTVWVFDGSYNPAKADEQKRRRTVNALVVVGMQGKVLEQISKPSRRWMNATPSCLEICQDLLHDLREAAYLGDYKTVWMAVSAVLADLQTNEGVSLRQIRTVLEADAYIAALCLKESHTAVLSTDSDFIVFDTPLIFLPSFNHRAEGKTPLLFAPRGRFSEVLRDRALADLVWPPSGLSREEWNELAGLDAFRGLLADYATLLGNDYFSITDPRSGQSMGFNKRVNLRLEKTDRAVSCDVTDKVSCARFLLAAALNGWTDDCGMLDLEGPPGDLLFPNAPKRKAGYVRAREQYSLTSQMANNVCPEALVRAGIAQQYSSFTMVFHHAHLLCPPTSSSGQVVRRRPMVSAVILQQCGFPATNLTFQRRMLYEILFTRGRTEPVVAGSPFRDEDGEPLEVTEEWVLFDRKTKSVDPRQPFTLRRIVLCEDPEQLTISQASRADPHSALQPDWRFNQATRCGQYEEYGLRDTLTLPLARRRAFLRAALGYPQDDDLAAQPLKDLQAAGGSEKGDRVLTVVLALRVMVVAYGHDGEALFDAGQRNHATFEALLYAAAFVLRHGGAMSGTFDPTRELRREYPSWLSTADSCSATARLRCLAFTLAYRVCLANVLDLSDVVGGALDLDARDVLALQLPHDACQRFVSLERRADMEDLGSLAHQLERAVLVGIEVELRRFYPAYRPSPDSTPLETRMDTEHVCAAGTAVEEASAKVDQASDGSRVESDAEQDQTWQTVVKRGRRPKR